MAKLKTGRHTGAIKAHRQSARRALRNRALKRKAREAYKACLAAADGETSRKLLAGAASAWDKAAKKGAVHWKTAARRKARLALRAKK